MINLRKSSVIGKKSSVLWLIRCCKEIVTVFQVLECHAFICKSEKAAMAMVHAATHAYEHKEGWADDAPPTDAYPQEQHLVAADPVKPRDAPEEFYKAPPKQGYFYANNKVRTAISLWNTNNLTSHILIANGVFTLSDTETDAETETDTDKLAHNPMWICAGVRFCAVWTPPHNSFYPLRVHLY